MKDVIERIWDVDAYPLRIPHVRSIEVEQISDTIQKVKMEHESAYVVRTEALRICFPDGRIFYQQTLCPPDIVEHSGIWLATTPESSTDQVHVTLEHIYRIKTNLAENPQKVQEIEQAFSNAGKATLNGLFGFSVA